MTPELSLLGFVAAAALLTVTPGLDTALVLRTAAAAGTRPAFRTGSGIVAGCFGWGLLVALGLGALLAASELAYHAVKMAGAAYLAWLGVRLLMSRGRVAEHDAAPARRTAGHFRRGFLTNMLNPKVGVFYVSFLPQFIPAGANVPAMTILMTAIHAAMGLAWFAFLIMAARPVVRAFKSTAFVKWVDRLTGGLFIALGVRLAMEQRA